MKTIHEKETQTNKQRHKQTNKQTKAKTEKNEGDKSYSERVRTNDFVVRISYVFSN